MFFSVHEASNKVEYPSDYSIDHTIFPADCHAMFQYVTMGKFKSNNHTMRDLLYDILQLFINHISIILQMVIFSLIN